MLTVLVEPAGAMTVVRLSLASTFRRLAPPTSMGTLQAFSPRRFDSFPSSNFDAREKAESRRLNRRRITVDPA